MFYNIIKQMYFRLVAVAQRGVVATAVVVVFKRNKSACVASVPGGAYAFGIFGIGDRLSIAYAEVAIEAIEAAKVVVGG